MRVLLLTLFFASTVLAQEGIGGYSTPSASAWFTSYMSTDGRFTSDKTTGAAFLFNSPSLGATSSDFAIRVQIGGVDKFWVRGDGQVEILGNRITPSGFIGASSTWSITSSGFVAAFGSTRVDLDNAQSAITTMIRNTTGASGTGLVGGSATADGTAGVVGVTLIDFGTGVTTTGPAVSKFKLNGAGDVNNSGRSSNTVQAVTVADDGAGTSPASTLTPSSSYVSYTCSDANGCTITLSETGAVDGSVVRIVNVSANACNFADTSGVTELAGAFAMGQYDALTLIYATDRWVEMSRSNN